mmetsp:Transcript_60259/g.152521  ORF Transcript_60259/g.152521 Transcript_60259/m.152521 type:complete len:386 (-) Transcript_60259:68-1225(-)
MAADLLSLGRAAAERRLGAASGSGADAAREEGSSETIGGDFGGEVEGPERDGLSLPGSSEPNDWQLPLPPVRFPLRDALLSFHDSPVQAGNDAAQTLANLEKKGPLKVHTTEKYRASRQIGRMRRSGSISYGLFEERPQPIPQAPPEADRARTPPKAMSSMATNTRRAQRKRAEEVGLQWPLLEESQSAPSLGPGGRTEVRENWSSTARSVLAQSRRSPGGTHAAHNAGGHGRHDIDQQDHTSKWAGASLVSYKNMQMPVKEWVYRGLEFTDKGLGVGDRFELEIELRSRRSPGIVYEQQRYGSVSLWAHDAASKPSQQACSKHFSTEAHRMGSRWRERKVDKQLPCPGTYEVTGFVEELQRKTARRAKGRPTSQGGEASAVAAK